MIILMYLYLLLMSLVMTAVFLITPLTKMNFYNTLVGFIIWLFFVYFYFFMTRSVKKMLDNKNPFYSSYYMDLRRDTSSFVTFLFTSIFTAILIYVLMKWSFTLYIPNISNSLISILSALNGLILGVLNFSLFFYLPKE
jgi:hypothetical protein